MDNFAKSQRIQIDFEYSRSLVACISDLLTAAVDNGDMTLDNGTPINAGVVCFDQAVKMHSMFFEMYDLYTDEKDRADSLQKKL